MNRATHIAVKQKKATASNNASSNGTCMQDQGEDFEAIEQAVMATPRGRWFLAEYLRRHQNDEVRRLVQALRKLMKAGAASFDATRQPALPEPERAALDGIRLLLARTADALAAGMAQSAEETLPEAAASRLLELLHTALPQAHHHAVALRHLVELLQELARLLGEPVARSEALPDSPQAMATGSDVSAAPPSGKRTIPCSSGSQQARITIRKHGHSQEVDIPLPEQQAGPASSSHPAAQTRRSIVRIRRPSGRAADTSVQEKSGNVACKPQSVNKVDKMQPSSLAATPASGE